MSGFHYYQLGNHLIQKSLQYMIRDNYVQSARAIMNYIICTRKTVIRDTFLAE